MSGNAVKNAWRKAGRPGSLRQWAWEQAAARDAAKRLSDAPFRQGDRWDRSLAGWLARKTPIPLPPSIKGKRAVQIIIDDPTGGK